MPHEDCVTLVQFSSDLGDVGLGMVEVVSVVPPGGRGGLEVDDDEAVAEEVELAALEDRQVS